MELPPYVAQVRSLLEAAATLGDERAREIAASLSAAAEPAVRLALVSALSSAADEITAALLDTADGPTVAVRLSGESAEFEVRGTAERSVRDEPPAVDDQDTNARISLRLPESLKADIETAARRDSVSVNTWLVRAASAGLTHARDPRPAHTRHGGATQRVTGWIN